MIKRLFLILFVFSIILPINLSAQTGEWTLTGSLNQARSEHQAVLLPDGKVLIAGGHVSGQGATSSCEIYDAETDSMEISRKNFTLVEINSKLVAIGGFNDEIGLLDSYEIYDLEIEEWVEIGYMNRLRNYHGAISFIYEGNQKILIAGGHDNDQDNSAEIYDPDSNNFSYTGFLNTGRARFTLTFIPSHNVALASGGIIYTSTSEFWDPSTQEWSYSDSMNSARFEHAAIWMPSIGKVIVVGGVSYNNFLASSEIYDPQTGEWSETDSLEIGRCCHPATLLPNGKVVVNGGYNPFNPEFQVLISTEIYDPETSLWQEIANMNYPRMNHTSTLLHDGQILTAGGIPWAPGYTELYSWNHQPQADVPQGLTEAQPVDTLVFTTQATDPDGDSISVRFSWDDGDTTDWAEYQSSGHTFEMTHVWLDSGEYSITVQVRDSWQPEGIHNSISNWSNPLVVTISDSTVGIHPEHFVPSEFALNQNYPNPFNPATTIDYSIPYSGFVSLIIFNIHGEEISRPVNEHQYTGTYRIKWDASNFSSGIYFYRLQTGSPAGGFVQTKKMLLLK